MGVKVSLAIIGAAVLAYSADGMAGTPAADPTPAKHSFLDPVGDFVRDDIWKPTQPFELVPGKDPNGWSCVLEPYVWAMGLSGDVGVKGLPPSNVNFSSKTVLENLDWGIFARGEVRKGRWGLLADGYYAALSGSGNLDNKIYDSVSLGLQQSLVSVALAYRIIDDRRGFLDVYAGMRYNFLGLQADASLNDSRIDQIGTTAADAIASRIQQNIQAKLSSIKLPSASDIESLAQTRLRNRVVEEVIERDPDLRRLVLAGMIKRKLVQGRVVEAMNNYVRAEAQALAARVQTRATLASARLQSAADSAKKKLANAIASQIESATPTYASGDQWWFDPIIGMRGQVNLTRWLFLAAQGDVGGFGAGSQIAWNVQATIGVNFTRNIFGEIGYRYMYVDYTNGGFVYDMNSFGLYSGIGVRF
jgi:hypothetical protein